jgi:hypothetical protein
VVVSAGRFAGGADLAAFFSPAAAEAAPCSSVAASWICCNDVARWSRRASLTWWRTLRAASGSFSIRRRGVVAPGHRGPRGDGNQRREHQCRSACRRNAP